MRALQIINQAAAAFDVHPSTVRGVTRTRRVAAARHRAMYEIRMLLGWSYPAIGKFFDCHYSTVIKAVQVVEAADVRACGGVYP